MAWFKVDDGFYTSHKVLQIPREYRHEAVGAWLLVAVWSADKMTDGVIPNYIIEDFGVSADAVERLISVGLWKRTDDGIFFHDWAEYQPTREEVEAKREATQQARSEAGKRGAEKRWNGKPIANEWQSNGKADGKTMANDSPLPEPEPEPLSKEPLRPATRGSRIPQPFLLNPQMIEWARTNTPNVNVNAVTAEFVDYWIGVPGGRGVKLDWEATWRNWLRRKNGDRGTVRPVTRDDANMAVIASLQAKRNEKELTQ